MKPTCSAICKVITNTKAIPGMPITNETIAVIVFIGLIASASQLEGNMRIPYRSAKTSESQKSGSGDHRNNAFSFLKASGSTRLNIVSKISDSPQDVSPLELRDFAGIDVGVPVEMAACGLVSVQKSCPPLLRHPVSSDRALSPSISLVSTAGDCPRSSPSSWEVSVATSDIPFRHDGQILFSSMMTRVTVWAFGDHGFERIRSGSRKVSQKI